MRMANYERKKESTKDEEQRAKEELRRNYELRMANYESHGIDYSVLF